MRRVEIGDPNLNITVTAIDEPGAYGASHFYNLEYMDRRGVPVVYMLHFQEGPVKEVGINGITGEALLAIVIDRLRSFQSGKMPCRENGIALDHLEQALGWLNQRTKARIAKGVEGKGLTHESA